MGEGEQASLSQQLYQQGTKKNTSSRIFDSQIFAVGKFSIQQCPHTRTRKTGRERERDGEREIASEFHFFQPHANYTTGSL